MPDIVTRGKLFTIEVDGGGWLIARSARSGIEIARVRVSNETTEAHVTAARQLVTLVFEDLQAQGYPHAHDDVKL